ncbi:TadE family type IV pilus minor pilin [Mycolicibacterium sp.]|uniref:TadE family type IV pilus minor pilin n=1 Tax=Mycolicibacterium sp. TaxID=2320850 RepID=UPI0025F6ADED|nr:TadE family type IV pilus minor pilin [Mycolicibacterium sp.]
MEAAFAVAALAVVLVLCVGGLAAVGTQVRCVDASREAARLAARGDEGAAADAVHRSGPAGAELVVRRDGGFVVARVSSRSIPLLGFTIAAEAVAAVEPGL